MPLPAAIVIGVGAEAGLGATLCRRFAREGHHVLAVGRSPDRLSAVVAQIGATGGSAEAVPADATSEAAVAALFAGAFAPSEIHDAPDLVVFNQGPISPLNFSRWRQISLKVSGVLAASRVSSSAEKLRATWFRWAGAQSSLRAPRQACVENLTTRTSLPPRRG
jgi:NAD(P)-dependent dehydrogenase (short-subunit alcohol dehydrogenase family)